FMAHPVPRLAIPDGALRLMTIRSHDQFNTTVYGLDDRYRGVKGTRDVIFLHPADMEERGIKPGDRVRVKAKWPGDARERSLSGLRATPYDVPRGCAAAYFPETNVLVAVDQYADGSRTPISKLIPVTIEREA